MMGRPTGAGLARVIGALAVLCASSWQTASAETEASSLSTRLSSLREEADSPWSITPFRPNYILPLTYSSDPNNQPLRDLGNEKDKFDKVEVKFQISFALPLLVDVVPEGGDLCMAYSQVSFWNAYNADISETFRDSNYEPELFLMFDTDLDVAGFRNRVFSVGFAHQSNGRGSDVLSRSWNRLYASALLERGNFVLKIKPWWRIPESEEDDDNPDIEKYLGYGELAGYYRHGRQVFSATVHNNLRTSGNKGSVEAGWSFPFHKKLKLYVQYFNGYGESLLDYDQRNQRIGIGLMLSDWL